MIALLAKFLPFVRPLLEKIFPDKSRAAELQAEKELIEARAFRRGRISPKYLLGYVLVVLFGLFGLVLLLHVIFPTVFTVSPSIVGGLRELIGVGQELL